MSDDVGDLAKKSRTIILCFDGTAGEYGNIVSSLSLLLCFLPLITYSLLQNTNVVKFFSLLKKDDFSEQLCYYQVLHFPSPTFAVTSRAIAWHRDVVQPWSRLAILLMGCQSPGHGFCLVRSSEPHTSSFGNNIHNRYLDAHVVEGYKFLMQNYRVGDKICIFGMCAYRQNPAQIDFVSISGFSRGAYTARYARK